MPSSAPTPAPGVYKFTVKSVDQAVALIREKLGPSARVISVRSIEAGGLKRFFTAPRLEVVAQIDAPAPVATPRPLAVASVEPALPPTANVESTDKHRAARSTSSTSLGLTGLLRRSGITEIALNRLQSGASWNELNTLPLHHALAETSRLLRTQAGSRTARPPLSRAAFLGGPGVGRTTALCKWITQEVFRRARIGHVVSVEFERANSPGPLPVFAEALGVPLAHFPCGTQPAVSNGFVYFDLPGISHRRPADNAPVRAFLDHENITERVLVLNAAYDRASLRDGYAAGRDLGATHLVFTHLDEVPQWGKLWDYLFDDDLEPLFLSTGASVTGDFEEDVPGAIVRRTLPDDET